MLPGGLPDSTANLFSHVTVDKAVLYRAILELVHEMPRDAAKVQEALRDLANVYESLPFVLNSHIHTRSLSLL